MRGVVNEGFYCISITLSSTSKLSDFYDDVLLNIY